ncbi:MAG: NUDIX hydrolase [Candidatus Nitrohelix vancouverensis]|uniref:GDP-mannose pyrophosphatase n=1 Tax=Candidatus Nitrohelix vancouverensis TaxID=2705534 RepID=A0A7T0C2E8_9BACT|nr:MAG: NUDIX hydrolase [Candidatus Nitrohelix vancouverensis]
MKKQKSELPPDFIIHQRRTVCENSKFNVYFDHVESGSVFEIRDFLVVSPKVKLDNLVTGCAVLPVVGDQFALLKIFRHPVREYSWEIPRGFVESVESMNASALRELKEETGLVCDEKKLIPMGQITPEAGILEARIQLFAALDCYEDRPFQPNEMGHREMKLFSKTEIEEMAQNSIIQDPATLITYYRYLQNK